MSFRSQRTAPPGPRRPIAPIHRGPQAVNQPTSGSHSVSPQIHHAPNAALLIDFDNVTMGIRSDLQTELKNLLASDIIKGKVSVQRAYADWRRYPQYIVPLAESSIDMIMAPAYGSAKKNATDIRLAIDALELVFVRPEIGTFILLSGDSDFSSLVIKLKEYGKYVIGVGIRESSSDLLVMNCDEYYSYNALAGLVKSGEEEIVKHDPWELVTEAVQRMKRNGDVMRADRLKQVMQQIDSSFDEKNVGKAKFSLFVTEAAKRGLLALNKLENGQLEVDLPQEGASSAATPGEAAVAVAVPSAEVEEERGRRSRRGRGRGREREDRAPREGTPEAAPPVTPAPSAAVTHAESRPAASAPARPVAPARPKTPAADGIGAAGLRLTREEAFDLVRRSVASVATEGKAVSAAKVRTAARGLLGRDSESLSERNFIRILHDAHDADIVDLRKRGGDYEVAVAAEAPSVERQLETAAVANAPAPKAVVIAPRGMGSRGTGRGQTGAKGGIPANLLSLGVVGSSTSAKPVATPSSAPTNTAKPAGDAEVVAIVEKASAVEPSAAKTPARGRKRAGAAKKAPGAKAKQPAAAPPSATAAKRARPARKKTAKSAAGADSK